MSHAPSRRLLGLLAGAAACLAALTAHAAPAAQAAPAAPGGWVNGVLPIPAPKEPPAFALPVADALANPAHEAWARQDSSQRLVYNVARPSLTLMPGGPAASKDAPAVILVPGGGFQFLAMDNEGYDVAKRLAPLGVRVFILKYRTIPLPDSIDGFKAALAGTFQRGEGAEERTRQTPYAVADAQAAIRAVRDHAHEWGVDPKRVGVLGFSAGAMTVLGALQANAPDARADFAGMIYGPTESDVVPPNAPPLFAALAADDRFFRSQDLSLIHNWRKSGASVELHLYSAGAHGFASRAQGTTSDAWFDQYALWLKAMKLTP